MQEQNQKEGNDSVAGSQKPGKLLDRAKMFRTSPWQEKESMLCEPEESGICL